MSPKSQQNKIVLPSKGDKDNVDSELNPLPLGVYTVEDFWQPYQIDAFKRGASDQVSYVYKKLGGDVLDIEITEWQVYAAYEEAVLEYSYLINIHQGKNILSNVLGSTTGNFDENGELFNSYTNEDGDIVEIPDALAPGTNVALAYPKFNFSYAKRISDSISEEANIGGNIDVYSASFDLEVGVQDYDLQAILKNKEEFADKIGDKKVTIKKLYWKSPKSSWYYYGAGGTNIIGNWQAYSSYANDSYFHIIPVWETKLQMAEFESKLYNRASHYSFEIKNNKLRLFPVPNSMHPYQVWFEFTVDSNSWDEAPETPDGVKRDTGIKGVNNLNTIPFSNIPYDKINSIGKQWIRRFALALCKEMLGHVRSKFASIPIPGNDIQMNGGDLISAAKEEQTALRDELKTILDELTYNKLNEKDAAEMENVNKILAHVPMAIFTG